MTMEIDLLFCDVAVATMQPDRAPYGLIDRGAVAVADGRIVWVGPTDDLPDFEVHRTVDGWGRLLTPGLIDCHTHLVFAGDRTAEFEARLGGATYEELSRSGGGIVSTVEATRAASEAELVASGMVRMHWLIANGATTVEVKSGYGLDHDSELRMLRAARTIGHITGVDVRTTLLAAHTVPPEFRDRRDDYLRIICQEIIPAAVGLADTVDVFCETIGFTADETRQVLEEAVEHGFATKVHADQLTSGQGSHLAAEYGALSADHLEHADEAAVAALAVSDTVAVLIPGASAFLDEEARPPVELLRTYGVPMAVATDLNPGTSPLGSLPLAMHIACTRFGLTPEEAMAGVTTNAAKALGLDDRGHVEVGLRADLALWDLHHPRELAYWFGTAPCRGVWSAGHPLIEENQR